MSRPRFFWEELSGPLKSRHIPSPSATKNATYTKYVASLIQEVRRGTSKPIICYPNTGESYNPATKTWFGSPLPFRAYVRTWYETGARVIGGCCRATPADTHDIAEFRAELIREGVPPAL